MLVTFQGETFVIFFFFLLLFSEFVQAFFRKRSSSFFNCLVHYFRQKCGKTAQNILGKADLLLMTKHATEKDRSLKTQLRVSKSGYSSDNCREKMWSKVDFIRMKEVILGWERLTILKILCSL